MKYVTTKKAVMNGYSNIISVPYCDLQNLLKYHEPIAYTSGVYGWNANIYEINPNTVIVTGYRPFGKSVPYELVREFERMAKAEIRDAEARMSSSYTFERKQKIIKRELDKYIDAFVAEALNA